jgi:hypothetical protein
MIQDHLSYLVQGMSERGTTFDGGLPDIELLQIEQVLGFRFPPDLRTFLQYRLPTSNGFPRWREPGLDSIRSRMAWPVDNMCFDIEHDAFWYEAWGTRPDILSDAIDLARERVAQCPALVPIYSHRYIATRPSDPGNPVYSVYQTDIIYYGYDLTDYLCREFKLEPPPGYVRPEHPKYIEFWGDIVS